MRPWVSAVAVCAGMTLLAGCAGADGQRARPDGRGRSQAPAANPARTPDSTVPARRPGSAGAAGGPDSAGPARRPDSANPVGRPDLAGPARTPDLAGPARRPDSAGPARRPDSANPAGGPSLPGPARTPDLADPARTPGPAGSARRTDPAGLPPVVDRVPTRDRVVFLTYDDGAARDPRFAGLVHRRRLPVSVFLTDRVAGPGYGHLARLRAVGTSIENHTLDHTALRGLPYAGQRAQICGQQHELHSRFGIRPHLLRPPHGTYDTTTLRAAADCGISAVVLWRASLGTDGHLTYTRGAPALQPGDIVSVPSGPFTSPAPAERTAHLLRVIEGRGLRVGRLEDHL